MAAEDMSFQQSVVIEFPVKEEIAASNIYELVQPAYGDSFMGAINVRRWVKR
jgi:hypothetical protein